MNDDTHVIIDDLTQYAADRLNAIARASRRWFEDPIVGTLSPVSEEWLRHHNYSDSKHPREHTQ